MGFPRSASRAVHVLLVAIAGCASDTSAQSADVQAAPADQAPPAASAPSAPANPLPDLASLVEAYGPAVVNVAVIQRQRHANRRISSDDPFYEFFRRFGLPQQNPQLLRGVGSGFIVSPDGYILTNAHVVAEADEVTVKLTDRREFQAKVVGADARTDIAVLKIDAKHLPTVRLGDPSKLRPGDWVLAIGSPFGYENSATAGIVSATSRSIDQAGGIVPFIQSDVAINPGNSGGPLFNMRGEVVGVNSQFVSRTGGYMGLSFAIPIDLAMDVRDQLIRTGTVTRSRIGVQIQEVTSQLAEALRLDRPRGAAVAAVPEGTPAARAGIKEYDVILAVNGKPIELSAELPALITRVKPGTDLELTIWRDGKEKQITVRTERLDEPQARPAGQDDDDITSSRLGIWVRPLTPQEKKLTDTEGSVVIEQVEGPAALAGLQPGDVVLGIDGKRVNSVSELRAAAESSGKTLALLIERNGGKMLLPLRVD